MTAEQVKKLRKLARSCGIATSYLDAKGNRVTIAGETLKKMTDLLCGAAMEAQTLRADCLQRGLSAAITIWDNKLPAFWLWLKKGDAILSIGLEPDTNEELADGVPFSTDIIREKLFAGEAWCRVKVRRQQPIPFGYYTVRLCTTAGEKSTFLISAPHKLPMDKEKQWGVFAPAYALQSQQTPDIGGYRELKQAAGFVRAQGGNFLGTLPLLPVFYEGQKPDFSPYSPVSRLFWNEIFLDVADLPGQKNKINTENFVHESSGTVDYQTSYQAKKPILQKAADAFFTAYPDGDDGYKMFVADKPCLAAYADFRAAQSPPADRAAAVRYHLFAQYACHCQLADLKTASDAGDSAALYLDYTVGVHAAGFDAVEFSHLFLNGATVGAPPDLLYTAGQNWGFRPYHPQELLTDRFAYFRQTLQHYFRYARMIRLDHVMGLFRLYCIPDNQTADRGTYIYYPFDALLAILCLEAWRHDGVLIGENLGTVPAAVNRAMQEHGIHRMWILPFEMQEKPAATFKTIEPGMIAGLNTHDMFPFAAFLQAQDVEALYRQKLLSEKDRDDLIKARQTLLQGWKNKRDLFLTALEGMAASPAHYVMVALEDFWQETKPQNIPGTVGAGNWSRILRLPLEEWSQCAPLLQGLKILDSGRKSAVKTA